MTQATLDRAWNDSPETYIRTLTDHYLDLLGHTFDEHTMTRLNTDQHTLLAYRIVLDEVMEGGWIQLIQNGWGPYVLDGPFPMILKRVWQLTDFGRYIYEVRKAYHQNREALEADLDQDQFMALYEQQEHINDLGDDFLDDHQETVTPTIATYVREHEAQFT